MSDVSPRNLSWLLQIWRRFLLSRDYDLMPHNRFARDFAPKDRQPDLPKGVHDKLACNHYYERDGRREMRPPVQVELRAHLRAPSTCCLPRSPLPGHSTHHS